MTRAIARLRRRTPDERRLVAHAIALHSTLALAIRIVPFGALRACGDALYRRRRSPSRQRTPEAIVWAVTTAAHVVPIGRTCLTQSLAAHWLLSSSGRASVVRYGIGRSGRPGLDAHAWVELDGVTLLDTAPAPRAVLTSAAARS